MNVGVGSLEWAARTGGAMSPADRASQLLEGALYQLRSLPAQWGWKLGLSGPRALRLDLEELRPPDSVAAKRALELCALASPDHLTNHCLRSYLWARVFAAQDRIGFDDEFLYLACLTHDLGLTDQFSPKSPGVHCFSLGSADAARALAGELGWDERRRDALAEAITLHLNVRVGLEKGAEAHLLNAATALDVAGVRYWDVPPAAVDRVVARHPRLGFKRRFPGEWAEEAARRPCSRACFLERYLGFSRRIATSPFLE